MVVVAATKTSRPPPPPLRYYVQCQSMSSFIQSASQCQIRATAPPKHTDDVQLDRNAII